MKFRPHLLHRRGEMEVFCILLRFLLPMGVVGITEVEALERGEETAHDLRNQMAAEGKSHLSEPCMVPLEGTHKIQVLVSLEVLIVLRKSIRRKYLAAAV